MIQNLEKVAVHFRCIASILSELIDCYRKIIANIEMEHRFIQENRLNDLKEITDRKIESGKKIVLLGSKYMDEFEGLVSRSKEVDVLAEDGKVNFSLLVSSFEKWLRSVDRQELVIQVISHELGKAKKSFFGLDEIKRNSNHKIEMNQYLIRKLLYHHQETFRFWQELALESEATYGATGTTNIQKTGSTIIVKT